MHIKSAREALEQSFHKISEAIYRPDIARDASHGNFGGGTQPKQEQASPLELNFLEGVFQEEVAQSVQEQASSLAGQQVGNYYLLRQLGQGGFADVYLGQHRYLKTHAAIKFLQTHMQDNAIQTFLQEAQAIARLKHRHIVRILDFGVENNIPFLVMEYAPLGTLCDRYPHDCYATLLIKDVVYLEVEHFFTFADFFEDRKTPDDHFSRPSPYRSRRSRSG